MSCPHGEWHSEDCNICILEDKLSKANSETEALDAIRKEQAAKIAIQQETLRTAMLEFAAKHMWDASVMCEKMLSATEADVAKFISEIEAKAIQALAD